MTVSQTLRCVLTNSVGNRLLEYAWWFSVPYSLLFQVMDIAFRPSIGLVEAHVSFVMFYWLTISVTVLWTIVNVLVLALLRSESSANRHRLKFILGLIATILGLPLFVS